MSILGHHGSNPKELLKVSKKQLHQVCELRCSNPRDDDTETSTNPEEMVDVTESCQKLPLV